MAFGIPLIASKVGAEGLEAAVGGGILLAESAADFHHCLQRLRDPQYRRQQSAGATAFVQQHFTPHACFGRLRELIEKER